MDLTTFSLAWAVALALMTSFSALWSTISGNQFREHILLSHLFTKGKIPEFTMQQRLIGWGIHGVFGIIFLLAYEVLWHYTGITRSLQWSVLFGVVIGIMGILGWMIMFSVHKNPPHIPRGHYYMHLLLAHIVFSVSAYFVYALMH